MEKGQIWQYVPIFIMFVWMMATPFLFPRDWIMRYLVNMMGMVISISALVVTNEVLKYKASEFTHYDCICRPSGNRMNVFATFLDSVEIPNQPGRYATAVTLGEKLHHSFYGPIEKGGQIVITHWGEWEKRMVLGKGKAVFKDQVVDHNKTAIIILHEPSEEAFDMDHLSPIPVFEMKDAPGDYDLSESHGMLSSSMDDGFLLKPVFMEGQKVTGAQLLLTYQKQSRENSDLRIKNSELQRQSLDWHQKAVRGEEVLKQVKNELHSVLSSKSDMKQGVVELLLTCLEAHTKIRNALKELRPSAWLTRGAVMMILGMCVIGAFLINPDGVLQWLSVGQNQFFVLLAVMGVAGVYFYMHQRRK